MKTIEERAKLKYPTAYDIDTPIEVVMEKDAYIQGAKEQQEIDIQKAVEFFKNEVDVKDHFRYNKEWYIEELTKAIKGDTK